MLLESLPLHADPGRFWGGHAVATLYSAAAASTSPASMWKHATAALRVESIDSEIFGRAQRALTIIDRDYPAWAGTSNGTSPTSSRAPNATTAPASARRDLPGIEGPVPRWAHLRQRQRRNCTRFA